jgi:hypothetical protein
MARKIALMIGPHEVALVHDQGDVPPRSIVEHERAEQRLLRLGGTLASWSIGIAITRRLSADVIDRVIERFVALEFLFRCSAVQLHQQLQLALRVLLHRLEIARPERLIELAAATADEAVGPAAHCPPPVTYARTAQAITAQKIVMPTSFHGMRVPTR